MERRILACIMLTLLLVSAIDFAAFSFVTRATDTDPGSIDWWFTFRHDENRTGYSTINVSTPIGSFRNFTATGMIRSSPAVFDDAVFVGSSDGYVYRWNISTTTFGRSNSSRYGAIYSSPCVVGGVVYVGSDDFNVYALDANNLSMIHSYPTQGAVKSSPVVVDNVLYAGSSDGYLYAWNVSTYKEMWRFWTASPVESSPTVSGDIVVFGTDDGRIYALDTKTGRLEWFNDTNGAVVSSPAIGNGMVFVGSNDTHVYALNATNGALVWNFTTRGKSVTSSPAIANGMVFVGSDNGYLYALNATSSALGGTDRLIWNDTTGGPIHSSPAVTANGIVVVGSSDNKIYAFNVSTGEQIDGLPCATNGPVYSSPAIAQCMGQGMIFIGSDDGKVYVLARNKPPVAGFTHSPDNPVICQTATFDASSSNSTTGNITNYSWNFGDGSPTVNKPTPIAVHVYETAGTYIVTLKVTDNFASNSTSQPITVLEAWPMFRHDPTHWGNSTSLAPPTNGTLWSQAIGPVDYSSPAVLNDAVFIGSGSTNDTFYALNATDNGSVIWSHSFGDPIHSSPAVVDNMVFIASYNGTVSAWYTNGTLRWTNITNGPIKSSPTVSSNTVFIGSENSHLCAFDEMKGTKLWDTTLDSTIDSSAAVAYGRVFVGSWNGMVYAINETTGDIVNTTQIGAQIISSPTVADGKVFIGAEDGRIYAFNLSLVQQWNCSTGGSIDSSPAVAYGRVFVGSRDGNLYAFDSGSGAKLWNKTIGSVGWSSPAIAEGKVFIGSEDGTIHALSIADGTEKWNYHTNGTVESSPAILNDTLYIGSGNGNLYAFHKDVHDIAVLNVTPAPTTVYQGDLVNINVTLMNEGSYNETNINVTVYYNETTINDTVINLTRGEQRTLAFSWDTSSIPSSNLPANFTISANATLISDEDLTNNNRTYYGNVFVRLPEIDLAVINVTTLNKTVVGRGEESDLVRYTMNISVTVENPGASTETFNVTTYANTTTIETKEVTLTSRQSALVNFTWDTTGFDYGNYTLSAYAWPVSGENNTANNNLTCSVPVHVGVPGDVSGTTPGAYDKVTNMKDIAYLVSLYQTKPTKPPWYPNADVNNDGVVDMKDIATAVHYFNHPDPDP